MLIAGGSFFTVSVLKSSLGTFQLGDASALNFYELTFFAPGVKLRCFDICRGLSKNSSMIA